ncbi:TVP38/TMEM64 family protein [Spirulina major]|uniref:TVP38/TMEM64 family protein n=1 Tax=Spirulina major TaxID=270636 RepID=UPI001587ECFD|nr:TVP38/TMEM64 family protein [Spirulina major]
MNPMRPAKRWLILIVWSLIGVAMVLLFTTPVRHWIADHQRWVAMIERGGVGLFLLAHLVLTLMGVPGTVLAVTGGLVFGWVWGTVLSVLGGTIGAVAAFCLARYCLHDWVTERFGTHPRLHWLRQAVQHRPLMFVLAVRFFPISPFNVVNFLLGLTPVPLGAYAVGTGLGIIPGTILYTGLGVTGKTALGEGSMGPFLMIIFVLSLLAIAPFLLRQQGQRSKL